MLQVGKRHHCEQCGTEVLVTKGSDGELSCCGETMDVMQPKNTASAD
ncbi:desulforedoxin [Acidimicrobiia bacterium EGI L10123]|nr:desulforedoxin [Acidimicrobiia bacterium EGI L10123]